MGEMRAADSGPGAATATLAKTTDFDPAGQAVKVDFSGDPPHSGLAIERQGEALGDGDDRRALDDDAGGAKDTFAAVLGLLDADHPDHAVALQAAVADQAADADLPIDETLAKGRRDQVGADDGEGLGIGAAAVATDQPRLADQHPNHRR